jgi:repressor LexA
MPKLTPRQQQVYDFICGYLDTYRYAPTLQEIAGHLKITGNLGVLRHLDALEKKGYLHRTAGRSRGIVISAQSTSKVLPIVGTVAAGPLSEALENIEGHLCVDSSLVTESDSFLLRVRGDSMIEAQIADGDLAVIRPQSVAENGDIVVAMLDGEATLKRFFREDGQIRLQPENSSLQPIILSAVNGDVAVIGKVTAIIRVLETT